MKLTKIYFFIVNRIYAQKIISKFIRKYLFVCDLLSPRTS